MPTTTYPVTASGLVWGGGYATGSNSGHTYARPDSGNRLDVSFTGTAAVFASAWLFNSVTVTVDGTPHTVGTTGDWTANIPIVSGLSDTTHTASIVWPSNAYCDSTSFLGITGSAPSLSIPSGLGPSYATRSGVASIPVDGSMDPYTSGPTGWLGTNSRGGNNGSIRFRATCTGLKVFGFINNQFYRVAVDGVDSGSSYSDSGAGSINSWAWVPLGTSYDGGAEHEYRVTCTGAVGGFATLMTVGGTLNTATLAAKSAWAFVGDSITQGQTVSPYDNGVAHPYRVGLSKSVGVRNLGVGGSKVYDYGATQASAVVALSPAPARVVVLYGTNDAVAIYGGTETVGQFQSAYQSMLQTMINGLAADTPIDCLTLLDMGSYTAQRPSLVSATQAAIAACTSNSAVRFIDTTGWIDPATDTTDGLHPTAAGYTKVVNRYLATFGASPGVLAHNRRRRRVG